MRCLVGVVGFFGVLVMAGCTSTQQQAGNPADAKKTDPDWYVKPENSRVAFKLTDSYSFRDKREGLVDDIDARDEAVQTIEEK